MPEIRSGLTLGGGRFELLPRPPAGRVGLVARAAGLEALLEAGLAGIIALTHRDVASVVEERGRSTSIRAEAASIGELFSRLVFDALDQIEALEIVAGTVRIDGLVRSDAGYASWGRLLIADTTSARPLLVAFASQPVVSGEAGEFTLQVNLSLS